DALGNDPNFATTVLNKLAEKLAKDQHGADIPDPALFVKNLGLKEAAKREVGTGTNQIPDMGAFASGTGWFKLPSGHIVQ
ncbi:phage tail protein, partial [Klebsiella pneumoniae]|nr:phage tail protein [Klebsiella pneumoniae]MDM7314535.1 phage tail protein [Klebsiella pneumoniae]